MYANRFIYDDVDTKLMCFQVARTLVLKVQIKALYNGVHLGSHERMTQDRST
jgi:hypothetical protein